MFYTLHIKWSLQWRHRFCLSILWNYNMPTRRAHSFVLNFGNVHQLRPCVWGTSRERGSWHNLYFWSCPCHPRLVACQYFNLYFLCRLGEHKSRPFVFVYIHISVCVWGTFGEHESPGNICLGHDCVESKFLGGAEVINWNKTTSWTEVKIQMTSEAVARTLSLCWSNLISVALEAI